MRGRLRTANTIQEQYERWMSETEGDEKKLKERVEYSADKVEENLAFGAENSSIINEKLRKLSENYIKIFRIFKIIFAHTQFFKCIIHWISLQNIHPELKDYYSCKHPSLQIFGEEEDDTACLVLYPPAPLHIKLGRDHEVYKVPRLSKNML